MAPVSLRSICVLLFLICWVTVPSDASPLKQNPQGPHRVLKAASRHSEYLKRGLKIQRAFAADLAYIESENQYQTDPIFTSRVQIVSEMPVLALEDIEHHLSDVKCTDRVIKLAFLSETAMEDAKYACHSAQGAYVITSHMGCNEEGERKVFRISEVKTSRENTSLELTSIQTSWEDAFNQLTIKFGYSTESHSFRRHPDNTLRRRVATTTVTSTAPGITTAAITEPPSITVPSSVASTVTSAAFDLAFSTANSTFRAPAQQLSQVPLTVGCKKCTTSGHLVLTEGAFDINLNPIDNIEDGTAFSLIRGGYVELQADSVAAHIELQSQPSKSTSFSFNLFELPILGFAIPGIGQAGVAFDATVSASYAINGAVSFTYGFELSVPTGSKTRLDLGNMSNSSVVGFDGATLSTLPFSANVSDVTIGLNAALHPQVPIGFSFNKVDLTAQAGLFLDLPALTATISTQAGTDATCQPLNSTNSTLTSNSTFLPSSALSSLISDLGPLVLIDSSVVLDIGVDAKFAAGHILPPFQTGTTFFNKTFALPTACLDPTSGFRAATAVLAEKTSSYIASVSSASVASAMSASSAGVASASAAQAATATATQSGKAETVGSSAAIARSAPWMRWEWDWQVLVVGLGVIAGGMFML